MNDKPMKYKDLEVKCECGRKIKFAYPIPALSEYHDDMYISQEMEYQERKQLQSNWNSLKEDLRWEINDYNGNIDIETRNIDSEFLRGIAWEAQELLDKMNELEGKDKE